MLLNLTRTIPDSTPATVGAVVLTLTQSLLHYLFLLNLTRTISVSTPATVDAVVLTLTQLLSVNFVLSCSIPFRIVYTKAEPYRLIPP